MNKQCLVCGSEIRKDYRFMDLLGIKRGKFDLCVICKFEIHPIHEQDGRIEIVYDRNSFMHDFLYRYKDCGDYLWRYVLSGTLSEELPFSKKEWVWAVHPGEEYVGACGY